MQEIWGCGQQKWADLWQSCRADAVLPQVLLWEVNGGVRRVCAAFEIRGGQAFPTGQSLGVWWWPANFARPSQRVSLVKQIRLALSAQDSTA